MREKFDFSKKEDQQKFEKLPKERRDLLVDKAQEEAIKMKEPIERLGEKEDIKIIVESLISIEDKSKEGTMMSYEEALLAATIDNLREKQEQINYIGGITQDEKIKEEYYRLENKIYQLKCASEYSRYFTSIGGGPKDNQLFIDEFSKLVEGRGFKFLSSAILEKTCEYGEIILENSPSYRDKIKIIDFFNKDLKQKNEDEFNIVKNILIQDAEVDLYLKLMKNSGEEINREDLNTIGENALKSHSPYDAIAAFSLIGNEDGLNKSRELLQSQIIEAQKKLERMPEELKTNGLMMHETHINFLNNILKEGILSSAEQYKRYGKINKFFYPEAQTRLGIFDFISVSDPWYGANTMPDYKSLRQRLEERIDKIINPFIYNYNYTNGLGILSEEQRKKIISEGYVGKLALYKGQKSSGIREVFFEAIINPEFQNIFNEIEIIYKNNAKITIDKTKTNTHFYSEGEPIEMPINQMFVPTENTRPEIGLLINPELERYNKFSSGFAGESLVKNKIDTKDIIGIVFTRKSVEDEFIYNHLIRLAQQYGVPLYEIETEGRDKTETAWQSRGKYKKHKLIWPN